MRRRIAWSLAVVLFGLAATGADATTLLRKEAAQLVDESEAIVVGTVVDVRSIPTADSSFAFTFVTFKVERQLKGRTADDSLTLRLAGGELGQDLIEIDGAPRFALGGRYLLFVADNGRSAVPLVGWMQGSLELVRHPLSGEEIVVDHRGRAIAGVAGGAFTPADLAMDARGLLVSKPEPGATVLDEEGVHIEPVTEPKLAAPAAATVVLAQLERLIARRAGKAGARAAATVSSASILEVPASVQFRAQAATAPGGVK